MLKRTDGNKEKDRIAMDVGRGEKPPNLSGFPVVWTLCRECGYDRVRQGNTWCPWCGIDPR